MRKRKAKGTVHIRFDGVYSGDVEEYWFDSYGDRMTGDSQHQSLRFYADGEAIAVIPKTAVALDRTVPESFSARGTWKRLKRGVSLKLRLVNAAANATLTPSKPDDVRYYGHFLVERNFILDGGFRLEPLQKKPSEAKRGPVLAGEFAIKSPVGIDTIFGFYPDEKK